MKKRPFWIRRIQAAWETRPIIWLSGVRRVGKTTLAKMFEEAVYMNCDLPSVVRMVADPESFYDSLDEHATALIPDLSPLSRVGIVSETMTAVSCGNILSSTP